MNEVNSINMNEMNEVKSNQEPSNAPVSQEVLLPVQPAAQIISFVEIECRVVLHKGMFCLVHAYDTNKIKIKLYQVELTTEEYNNWIDDATMETLILSKCGLVRN